MMILFGFLIFPISEHSFVLKAAKLLFIARTRDPDMFAHDARQNIEVKASTSKGRKELELHRAIKIRQKDNICLYLSMRMGSLFPTFCWKNKTKFQKLYKLTREKIED